MMRMMVTMLGMVLAIGLARPSPAADAVGAHAFAFTSIEGQALPMASFTGRPVLVVNTASLCGFTYQYAALQRLSDAYRAQGLIVLGVPSNDFGGQEPGTAGQIKTFCTANFDIDFPLTEKVHVRGAQSHPLFVWLRDRPGRRAQLEFPQIPDRTRRQCRRLLAIQHRAGQPADHHGHRQAAAAPFLTACECPAGRNSNGPDL